MSDTTLDQRRIMRLQTAFLEEELAGLKLATQARVVALVVIAFWLLAGTVAPHGNLDTTILAVFAIFGVAHYWLACSKHRRPWHTYIFVAADFALLTLVTIGLDMLIETHEPPQMVLRREVIVYFFLLLALLALSYTPGLMLWAGLAAVATWSIGVALIWIRPETLTTAGHATLPPEAHVAAHLDPHFVNTDIWFQEIMVLMLAAGILACAVWRGKRLVERQAIAERERGNLSRYFSPNMVDQLAGQDEPLGEVRNQHVAVLFADIVGFTKLSEALEPEAVIDLLRAFHGRMAQVVFAHTGTIDKYIGDAIMATFGTPDPGPRDATDALVCAQTMVSAVAEWNEERRKSGDPPVFVGVGLHYGPAVLGDIGGDGRLEFAVVGDTVNVASRLEALTRDLGTDIAISDDLVLKARKEGGQALLEDLTQTTPQRLRNRETPLNVWTWKASA